MNKFKLYRQIKNEYAYSLFKNNQTFEKVRALIIKDGKILLVHKIKSDRYTLPGGGVENDENIEIAVVRESYEEAKARVKLKSIVGVLNYDVNMTFNGENFTSTRIEYYCLCEFLGFVKKKKYFGLNGEFFEKVEVVWHSIDNLEKTNLSDYVISKVRKVLKMQLKNNEKIKDGLQVFDRKNKKPKISIAFKKDKEKNLKQINVKENNNPNIINNNKCKNKNKGKKKFIFNKFRKKENKIEKYKKMNSK